MPPAPTTPEQLVSDLEQRLQQAEERYRTFTELTADFCFVCSRRGDELPRLDWIGGQLEQITGYREDELLELGCWLPMIHPDDRERVMADRLRLRDGERIESEFRFISKNHDVIWVREHLSCRRDHRQPDQLLLFGTARDITQLRESAQALQAAESAYRTIFNAVNDAIFILDPGPGIIIDCNRTAPEMFARPRADLIGITPLQLTPPDQPGFGREEARQVMQAAASGTPQRYEWFCCRPDNSTFWVEVTLRGTEINGRSRLLAVVRDITERKLLIEQLQRAQFALDRNSDPIFWADRTSRFVYVNDAACSQLGYTREELLQLGIRDVDPAGPDRDSISGLIEQLRQAGSSTFETVHRRRDGSRYPVEVAISLLEYGDHLYLCGIARDITERKLAAARLEESEHRFRTLVEQIPNLPVQGLDRNRRFIFWNDASTALYGYTREEVLGRTAEELFIPPCQQEAFIREVEAWMTGGPPIPPGEVSFQRSDGSPVTVFSSHALQQNSRGEPEMYCIDIDLTDLKQTERQLDEARLAAEAANRAKNEFLANMSHEVRTPLNGIMGLSQLLRTTGLTNEQASYLDMLDDSSRTLLMLINDILDISKIEAGSLRLEETSFNPAALLQEVVEIYRQPAAAKGIGLQLEITEPLPPLLLGDPLRLRQVLINLVGNGVKFTACGGVILRARLLEEQAGAVRLCLEVEDSGSGMTEETLQKIFSPFTQGDASTTRLHGGSGLGLAICRRLTDLMGGSIRASSSLGHGSRFTVVLPFPVAVPSAVQQDAAAVQQDAAAVPAALRILLVEDQEVNRIFVQRLLERQGHRVTPAADGLMALDLLERDVYDLMMLDIQMPGMGGEEVLAQQRGRERHSGRRLPVIALTAHALAGDRELLLAEGFDGYAAKPVQMDQLQAEMARVLTDAKESNRDG